MKAHELREKSSEELHSMLREKQEHADSLRFLLAQKKVKNVKELAGIRKDVARILTVLKSPIKNNAPAVI